MLIGRLLFVGLCQLWGMASYAQHTPQEIAASFAVAGHVPLIGNKTQGFYSRPFVGRLRFQVVTNGVQSLSVYLEHAREWRDRREAFTEDPRDPKVLSDLSELLHMTTLGFELYRTLLTEGDLRIGAGLGLGYGLGGASLEVREVESGQTHDLSACQTWQAIQTEAVIRGRQTVHRTLTSDVGIVVSIRYWGFPYAAPLGECPNFYNGPELRSLHELGYLVGVSYGF